MLEIIKQYLWIYDNTEDSRLTMLLDWVMSQISGILWDISYWEKTIRISKNRIKNNRLWLLHINPISLISVWWVPILADDYFIEANGEVYVKNIDYSNLNVAGKLEVKYISWYHLDWENYNLPYDIMETIVRYIDFLSSWWKDIQSETTWPRSVSYATGWWISNDGNSPLAIWDKQFIARIKRFIPIHLRVYDI